MRNVLILTLLGAASVLGEGLGVKTADPKLQAFADMGSDKRYAAWRKLIDAGRSSVPTFVAMLGEKHNALRGLGASGLAQLGPIAAKAVPALREAAFDESRTLSARLAAIAALGRVGPAAGAAVPSLSKLLESKSRIEVLTSALALTKIDPGAPGLADAIVRLLQKDGLETPTAIWMASRLGAPGAAAADRLAVLARDSRNPFRRRAALRALRSIGRKDKNTLELLRGALKDPDRGVRVEAASILSEWSVRDAVVQEVLADCFTAKKEGAMRGWNETIRVIAAAGLLRSDPSNKSAAACIREALGTATLTHQTETREALRQLRIAGRGAAPFADLIEKIAPQSIPHVEGEAALALWAITGDRERVLKIARRSLERGYFEGCADVVRLVAKLERTER